MPLVRILSNVKLGTSTVDINHVLKTISKSVATVFDSPERVVMIDLELDKDMCFQASTDLCAFIEVRSIGKINTERNPKTIATLTDTVATLLNVPQDRIFIHLNDVPHTNWGAFGKVVPPPRVDTSAVTNKEGMRFLTKTD